MPSILPPTQPILLDTASTAIIVFSAVFLAYQLYRIFVYPYYVSPLRHLPGPKVPKRQAMLASET